MPPEHRGGLPWAITVSGVRLGVGTVGHGCGQSVQAGSQAASQLQPWVSGASSVGVCLVHKIKQRKLYFSSYNNHLMPCCCCTMFSFQSSKLNIPTAVPPFIKSLPFFMCIPPQILRRRRRRERKGREDIIYPLEACESSPTPDLLGPPPPPPHPWLAVPYLSILLILLSCPCRAVFKGGGGGVNVSPPTFLSLTLQ